MPFMASTLQTGGYYSYEPCKLQAAQVTFTEPDSAVSVCKASQVTLLKYAGQSQAWKLKG